MSTTPIFEEEPHKEPVAKPASIRHKPHHPRPKGKKKGAIYGAVLVVALLVVGIWPRWRQAQELQADQTGVANNAIPVNAIQPQPAPSAFDLTLPSSIQAMQDTAIFAQTTGYLHKYFVDIGTHVKQGQLLATIESPEVDQQLNSAQADVSRQAANGDQAIANVSRMQADVALARAQVASSQSDLKASQADVQHDEAKLIEAQGAEAESKAKITQADKELDGKKAELTRAKARENLADKTYRRWQQLARGGAVSGQDLDESEADYETSVAAVTGAQADVASAEADVVAAQSNLSSAKGNVQAAKADISAAKQKVGAAGAAVVSSRANVDATLANVQAGKANVSAARASLRSSQDNVSRVGAMRSFENITAPFSGVITARNVDTGSLVQPESGNSGGAIDPLSTVPKTGLFGIAETNVLRIQVNVPQAYVGEIHSGQEAQITVQQLPKRSFVGRVFDTAGALDAASRTMLAEVRVPNEGDLLIPGMFAQVHFMLHDAHPGLLLSAAALIIDANGTRVAVVTPDSKIHFRTVQIGRDLGKEVEIMSGLNGNERVVANPTDDLTEGCSVQVVKSPS